MIGVSDLSEKAKKLEMAAKENEENYILANHEAMIRDYGQITGFVKEQLLSGDNDTDDEVFEFEPENNGGARQ